MDFAPTQLGRAAAADDEADRAHDVAMGLGDLAGFDELRAHEHGVGRRHLESGRAKCDEPPEGIFQPQRLSGSFDRARDVPPFPHTRLEGRFRLVVVTPAADDVPIADEIFLIQLAIQLLHLVHGGLAIFLTTVNRGVATGAKFHEGESRGFVDLAGYSR